MSVNVRVPTTFRTLTAGASTVSVDGSTLAEVIDNLEAAHPGFRDRLLDSEGNLVRHANLFVDEEDVRFLSGLATEVPDGGEVSIMPAVAGG